MARGQGLMAQGQGLEARGQGVEVQGQGLVNWSSRIRTRTRTFLEDNNTGLHNHASISDIISK